MTGNIQLQHLTMCALQHIIMCRTVGHSVVRECLFDDLNSV